MRTLARQHAASSRSRNSGQLPHLRRQRKKLASEIEKLDKEIARISNSGKKALSPQAIDQWLEELSAGIGNLPPLPADFSRADLYDDHD
jgi:hypothetical protein